MKRYLINFIVAQIEEILLENKKLKKQEKERVKDLISLIKTYQKINDSLLRETLNNIIIYIKDEWNIKE